MRKYLFFCLAICILAVTCTKVPVTGRKQLSLLPESQLTSLSLTSYKAFLDTSRVVKSGQDAAMIKRVGNNISKAVTQYLNKNGLASRAKEFNWEFNLVEDKTVNAWCMPGGKVAIYTGILPVAQDEAGLAVVMGHEVAHAVARHGNERMSQGLLQQIGAVGLAVALSQKPAQTRNIFMQAYGIGSALAVMLPFSRKQESEADEMGLIFMAMAGYNPEVAPGFWVRMGQQSKGQAPPEFLSTHPSHQTRTANLKKWIPKAKKYYTKPTSVAKVSGDYKGQGVQNTTPSKTSNSGTTTNTGNGGNTGGKQGGTVKKRGTTTSGGGNTNTNSKTSGKTGTSGTSSGNKTIKSGTGTSGSGTTTNPKNGKIIKKGKVKRSGGIRR